MPMLLFGIDLTDMMRDFWERSKEFFKTGKQLDGPPDDEINKGLQRRP
jgi:hypothetical protein